MNLAEAPQDCVITASQAVGTESRSLRKWLEERPYRTTWQTEPEVAIIVTVPLQRSALDAALGQVRLARSGRDAYERFSCAVGPDVNREPEAFWFKLMDYLGEPGEPYKHVLLSWLADQEVELTAPWMVRRIAELLSSSDRELARSAALALLAGGALSSSGLTEELERLDLARRRDLQHLIGMVDGPK